MPLDGGENGDGSAERTRLLRRGDRRRSGGPVILVIVLSGSEDERDFDPAPTACVSGWNGDPANRLLGRHQAAAHRYGTK